MISGFPSTHLYGHAAAQQLIVYFGGAVQFNLAAHFHLETKLGIVCVTLIETRPPTQIHICHTTLITASITGTS